MRAGKRIEIKLDDGKVTIRDFGRGIPLGKVVDAVSKMNTGGKYDSKAFKKSVGLNGVGTKAVNALSDYFRVRSFRDGRMKAAEFSRGIITENFEEKDSSDRNGTEISFIPDADIFLHFKFRKEYIERMLRNYAYLNPGLKILFNGETFFSENGLKDLLDEELENETLYPIVHLKDNDIEVAITHTDKSQTETYFSFVNGQNTTQGGTHLNAFREAYVKTIREFFNKNFDASDVRKSIVAAVSINVEEPVFESQTKTKLGSNDIGPNGPTVRTFVIDFLKSKLDNFLHKNPEVAEAIQRKILISERERKELSGIQKLARERVFSLKGKPLNCYGLTKKVVYENEEFNLLQAALNIEESLEDLRYNQVIIATDADVDGMHIRLLMITFFLQFFPDLIKNGHLYILQTPLFRVRNKKETRYCYTEQERVKALNELGKNPEITRFKGLGEISPDEFKHFIGKDIRLEPVVGGKDQTIDQLLEFYMGKNTPDRQTFILENLVVEDPDINKKEILSEVIDES